MQEGVLEEGFTDQDIKDLEQALKDEGIEDDLDDDPEDELYDDSEDDPDDNSHRPQKAAGANSKKKKTKSLYARFTHWLVTHTGTPHTIALGFAVGMFVALTPTVGFQMVLGAFFAHLVGGNRLIAAALAWITNPLTIVPIYYFNYQVGRLFMGGDASKGKAFIRALSDISLLRPETLWEGFQLMAAEFMGIAGVLWVGSLVVATVVGLVSYPIVRRLVEVERKLAEKRRQRRLQRKKLRKERRARRLKRKLEKKRKKERAASKRSPS